MSHFWNLKETGQVIMREYFYAESDTNQKRLRIHKTMMRLLNHRLVCFFLILVIAVGCTAMMEMVAYRIDQEEYGFKSTVFSDGSEAYGIYGCELVDNTLIITGIDPQFVVNTFEQVFSKIRIIFREPVNQNTLIQLFFVPVGEGASEGNSLRKTIEAGTTQETIEIPKAAYTALRFDIEQSVTFDGIYIGEREWNLRPYQPDPIRIGIIFGIVFVPLSALVLFGKRNSLQIMTGKKKRTGLMILLCNLYFAMTVFFFQPLEQMLTHIETCPIQFRDTWWIQLLLGIGITLILSIFVRLIPEKYGRLAAAIILGIGIAYLFQSLLFNEDRILSLNTHWSNKTLSIFIWFGIIILTTVMSVYFFNQHERETKIVLCLIACVLFVIQVFNFTVLATISDTSGNSKLYQNSEKSILQETTEISMERGLPFLMKDLFIK